MPLDAPPAWLAEVQKPPAKAPEDAARPGPILFDRHHAAITTAEGWRRRRAELADDWRRFLGEIPRPAARPVHRVLEEDRDAGVRRQLIRYESEPGLPVEAYLLAPLERGPRRGGVVVLHSTVDYTIRQPAGLEGPADVHLGVHLARQGYVAICPRCYLWQYGPPRRPGDAVAWLAARHPDVRGMAKMLHDARRAVDLLETLPEVDPARIGAIGHSLGGKEVLYLAAFDERVRASVSSEVGVAMSYSNWDAPWYLGEATHRPGFPLDHGQILAMVAPRAFLLLGGDSADGDRSWPYVEAALPVWKLLGAPRALGLFNHHRGHAFPPIALERSLGWLDWFLRPMA